jgi:Tfp pilus assembly protein PilP
MMMTRQHIPTVLIGGILMIWAVACPVAVAAPTADTKPAPGTQSAVSPSGAPTAKGAPAPAAVPAGAPATALGAGKAAPTSPDIPAATPAATAGSPAAPAGKMESKETPAAVPLVPPGYVYTATGKSDPFKPFMETEPPPPKKPEPIVKKQAPVKGVPISPLQQAEIQQFRLIGIAGDDLKRTAVVEDRTSKRYYPLSVGTVIGANAGRVVSILADRVIVEERIATEAKKVQIRRLTLMLHAEDEGKQ